MGTRTNIVLDDKLVKRAMKATGAKTKREVVDIALRQLVHTKSQKNILDLVGQDLIDPGYDVRVARGERARGSR
ncbi:MAG: type II toxin-antitoxin system VapB family antitoxin [Xanthomonadaceae bacterium]|nr:type II toxin-antitoxin system VapB family antitoxin [Xanthomonadaceae bacterium]